MPHLQDHARLRRHRLRRLAASGGRRVDSGAARRRAARRSTGAHVTVHGRRADRRRRPRARAGGQRSRSRASSTPDALVRALNARLPRDGPRARRRGGAAGVSRAVRRAREDLSLPDLERRRAEPVRARATRGTCPGPLDVDAMRAAARARRGATTSRRSRRAGSAVRDDRARDLSRRDRRGSQLAIREPQPRSADRLRGRRRRLPPPHGPHHRRHAGRGRARAAAGRRGSATVLASRDRAQAGPTAPPRRAVSRARRRTPSALAAGS